ncbi:CsiV family protein [Gammaproteobacteria bacterium]|nr:CsiV family protein [Gammaproteobacteria bacterium]
MRFYKIILIIIIQSSLVMTEEALELKEYQIELIIFKHLNVETDEIFDDNFITPSDDVLSFYEPKLQINKKSFDVKVEENFFNKLFTSLKPLNIKNIMINKEDVSSNISNPKSWYRKNNNLETLNKLNKKLLKNNNYEVLDSFSWVQNIEDKESAVYLHHEVIEKQYGFLLKLYRSRFLHTDLKAYLGSINLSSNDITKFHIKEYENRLLEFPNNNNTNNNIKINLNKANEFIDIISEMPIQNNQKSINGEIKLFIDQNKRIFNNEIHYFDHPYFGVVISVKEI